MKKRLLYFLTIFTLSFGQDKNPSVYADGIAAVVGDHIVLKSDIAQLVNMSAAQQRLNFATDVEKLLLLQKEVIRSVVDQKIILEMAAVDSIEVEDKDVDRALDQQIEMFLSQSGGEEQAEKMLGQSLKSFRREFWYEMKDRLTTERYQQTLIDKIGVSRGDVETFFSTYQDSLPSFPTMVKMRHLLVSVEAGKNSRELAYKKLSDVREEIIEGGSFGDFALLNSQDPGSSQKGGSLGFVRRGSLVPEFESVAFSQSINILSEIIETQFGYHIIETQEKRGDKIRARHILIVPEIVEEDESIAYKFALTLKDTAKTLEDFKRLTALYSKDVQTKELGGDLGWINPNNSPIPEISQIINFLDVGVCSLPVRTEQGYHLFWVDSFRPGGRPSLAVHWPEIENMALSHKHAEWYGDWIESVRELFFIQINDW